jgi:hypothetical protein
MDASKIDSVRNWPRPGNLKELRGFLGLSGYYRKFIRHYAILSQPLTALLRKGTLFVWTPDQDKAFQVLKDALSSAPVLALPDFNVPFVVETDACDVGVGDVLSQKGHPVAFVSRALGPRNRGLSVYEKEYLAILLAIQQWRPYLQLREFVILTDHKSLVHLTDQRLHTEWQRKALTKLMGLQYTVQYKKGIHNGAADALSRKPVHSSPLMAATECVLFGLIVSSLVTPKMLLFSPKFRSLRWMQLLNHTTLSSMGCFILKVVSGLGPILNCIR